MGVGRKSRLRRGKGRRTKLYRMIEHIVLNACRQDVLAISARKFLFIFK
jgi:hypothetical protein